MITYKEANEVNKKFQQRVYKLVKRFEKEQSVFVSEINYKGDLNGAEGTEKSEIETDMMFFR